MQMLDDYFKLQKEIYDYFGYTEDWVVIPIEDRREVYWTIEGSETDGKVWYSHSDENQRKLVVADFDFEADGVSDDVYSDVVYTQRFLPKWVYRRPEYTMICVDTQTDGNKFLAIFDNAREIKKVDEDSHLLKEGE